MAKYLCCLIALTCGFSLATTLPPALAQTPPGPAAAQATIIEHLGKTVNLDLPFVDKHGAPATLRQKMLAGRPAILTPVYYECPRLCTLTLNGTYKLLNSLDLRLGEDYEVITVSFDPAETPELAKKKAASYTAQLKQAEAGEKHWHFLTGQEANTKQLMDEIGFKYSQDGEEWVHTAIIVLLTPDGVISRYFYGVDYPPRDVRYALVEAGRGAIGTTLDRVFLYCFRYDSQTGRYTPMIWRITRIISLSVLALLAAFIAWLRYSEKRAG